MSINKLKTCQRVKIQTCANQPLNSGLHGHIEVVTAL